MDTIGGGYEQQFASPGEALEHFGIKGMRWGVRKDQEFESWGRAYKETTDGIAHGSKEFALKDPQNLRVDHSAGFADIRPKGGYASEQARRTHDDLVSGLQTMRETHPNVAALKIVVIPASHIRGGPGGSAQAAVLHTKPGEIMVAYNDKVKDFSPRQQKRWEKWIPGMKHEGYVANHEMGHVLTAAGRVTPPCWDMVHSKTLKEALNKADAFQKADNAAHDAIFKRHGIKFKEITKLSPYAATSRQEALAELVGNYYTPQTYAKMSPELRAKAKAAIEEMGGGRDTTHR